MDLINGWRLSNPCVIPFPVITNSTPSHCATKLCLSFKYTRRNPLILLPRRTKRASDSEPVLESSIVQEVSLDDDEEEEEFIDEFEYGTTTTALTF